MWFHNSFFSAEMPTTLFQPIEIKTLKIKIMKTRTFLLASSLTVLTGSLFAQQPMGIHVSPINPTCNGYRDGAVVINISGGVAPYRIDGVQFTGDTYVVTDMSAGNYEFSVSDVNLDRVTANVTLVEPSPIPVHANTSHVTTFGGSDGAIDIETGVPCKFIWSSTNGSTVAITAQDQTGLTSDVYEAIVIEKATGCQTKRRFEIRQPQAPVLGGNYNPDKTGFVNGGNTEKSVTVYPNPSAGSINIKADDKTVDAFIINEMGAVIYQIDLDLEAGIQSLELERGVYTLYYTESDGNRYAERIIIK
jgi:hypothetical protein